MKQLLEALNQTKGNDVGSQSVIVGMVQEWKGMGQNLVEYLGDWAAGIERREQNLISVVESLEKRMKDLEERERELEGRKGDMVLKEGELCPLLKDFVKDVELKEKKLDEQLKLVNEHIESLEVDHNELQGLKQLQCEKLKKIEAKEREIDSIRGSLEKYVIEVEQREKELDLFHDKKLKMLQCEKLKQVEEKEKDLDLLRGSLEERLNDVQQREKEFNEFCDRKLKHIEEKQKEVDLLRGSLKEKLREAEQREKEFNELRDNKLKPLQREKLKQIEEKENEIDLIQRSLKKRSIDVEQREKEINELHEQKLKRIEELGKEIDLMGGNLKKRLIEVEQRERELDLFQDKKLRELVSKEELWSKKREEFVEEVKLEEKKLREGRKMGCGLIKRLEAALSMVEGVNAAIDARVEEIESREAAAREALAANVKEAELIHEQLEKRYEELEKMLKECSSSQEDSTHKVELKDQHPSVTREELLKEIKLRDEKITEQQMLGHQLLEQLEELTAKKFNKMESLQLTLNVTNETFCANDSGSDGELVDLRLQELKKREDEFQLYQVKRERELELEEQKLVLTLEGFIQEVKYREEKFIEQEKLLYELLRRLESAQSKLVDMNKMVRKRFKELSSKERELGSIKACYEKKTNKHESRTREWGKGIKAKEDAVVSKVKTLKLGEGSLKEKNINSKEDAIVSKDKTLKLGEESLKEKNLKSTKEFSLNKQHQRQCLNGEASGSHLTVYELQRPTAAFGSYLGTEQQAMDVKRLEMVINYPFKDLELMGDDVNKIFLISPDPARLVLTAMEGFCTPQFIEGDMESNARRIRILLLDQLTKMSPNIQPCVREAAIRLVNEWKSKIRAGDANELQVLEFLYVLAAYKLHSLFDKDELMSFLKVVANQRQTPELCRILDLTDKMEAFVRNLIHEKKYLLASTYIYECELEKALPQGAVLKFYMNHVTMIGNAKRKKGHNSADAQLKAIFDEIADLRLAIEHIVKHGLESAYSPDTLMERIQQLETDMASLKNGNVSSLSTKQEKGERSSRLQDKAAREAAPVANAQLHEQGLEEWTTPLGWTYQNLQRKQKKRRIPQNFHESPLQGDMETKPFHLTEAMNYEPVRHPSGYNKRHKASLTGFLYHGSSYENRRLRR